MPLAWQGCAASGLGHERVQKVEGHLHTVLEAGCRSIAILLRHALRLVLRQHNLHIQQYAA